MNKLGKLLIAIVIGAYAFGTYANAAAAAIAASQNNKKRGSERSSSISPIIANDGFAETLLFFRNGPEFRLCAPPSGDKSDGNIYLVKDGDSYKCQKKIYGPKPNKWDILMDNSDPNHVDDLSPQEYLDRLYEDRELQFVGLSGRIKSYYRIADEYHLVIFYKIIK